MFGFLLPSRLFCGGIGFCRENDLFYRVFTYWIPLFSPIAYWPEASYNPSTLAVSGS